MSTRMKTGIEGLDRVLCGGLLHHNSILLKGAPGCGKTTLGIQIVYNGATMFDEPGIVVLFEQFPQQLYRDIEGYGWNLKELEDRGTLSVLFAEPDEARSADRLASPPLISRIHEAAAETGARRVLIDSVSHILNLVESRFEARTLLLRFINSLKSIGLTPIMTAEAEERAGIIGVDEYLSDCVLLLSSEAPTNKAFPVRDITIRKTRGHEHVRGRHAFRLSGRGVEVFPRQPGRTAREPATGDNDSHATAGLERVSTGVAGLDGLLGGGYVRGTSTILAGMPGAFKTTLGVQFLTRAKGSADRGLMVSFSEQPEFLSRLMREKGLAVQECVDAGTLELWHFTPKEILMEELLHRLEVRMREGAVQRLVIDGIPEIERSIDEPGACKDVLQAFLTLCYAYGVTALFTLKLDELRGNDPLAGIRYASMFDGIVYLGTIEIESAVHKVVSVLKMRGGSYSGDLREIGCDNTGLYVLDKFVGMSGILSGHAQGQYKKTVEELFQPLYFVRDFIGILADQELPPEQQKTILGNLRDESGKLVARLQTHFDIKPQP